MTDEEKIYEARRMEIAEDFPPETPRSRWISRMADLEIELDGLLDLLREARPHVWSQSEADHMLDGFGERKHRPSDDLLNRIDSVLANAIPRRSA